MGDRKRLDVTTACTIKEYLHNHLNGILLDDTTHVVLKQ